MAGAARCWTRRWPWRRVRTRWSPARLGVAVTSSTARRDRGCRRRCWGRGPSSGSRSTPRPDLWDVPNATHFLVPNADDDSFCVPGRGLTSGGPRAGPVSPLRQRPRRPVLPRRRPIESARVRAGAARRCDFAPPRRGVARWCLGQRSTTQGARAVRRSRRLQAIKTVRGDARDRRGRHGRAVGVALSRSRWRTAGTSSGPSRPTSPRSPLRRRGRQRQGLHPGARRHRVHLGTRRPPVPAPSAQLRPWSRSPPPLASGSLTAATPAYAARCTSTWGPGRRASATTCSRKSSARRAAGEEPGRPWPRTATRAAPARAVGTGSGRRDTARDRGGAGPGRRDPARHGHRRLGGADDPRARQRRAVAALRAALIARRPGLVPAVLRARRRIGPRRADHQGRPGGRRLDAAGPEGVDVGGPGRGLGHLPGPHGPRCPSTRARTSWSTCRAAGLDVRPLREITGEALFNEVFLDNVFVPDDSWWANRATAGSSPRRPSPTSGWRWPTAGCPRAPSARWPWLPAA